eukprot:TRINITY_DN5269_c0_g5_i4.p1 TRINITY_DN5269_c0_g5~~TRINITY_DN5269_c0_g5_i4.p1  ORF type:complete len:108 (-),score=17.19 TRINITY_DN5269_c0_g5_i4:183-506(-)
MKDCLIAILVHRILRENYQFLVFLVPLFIQPNHLEVVWFKPTKFCLPPTKPICPVSSHKNFPPHRPFNKLPTTMDKNTKNPKKELDRNFLEQFEFELMSIVFNCQIR